MFETVNRKRGLSDWVKKSFEMFIHKLGIIHSFINI